MPSLDKKLLSALLQGSKEDQTHFLRECPPESSFRDCDEQWRFLFDFLDNYGAFPPLAAVREKFPDWVPVRTKSPVKFYLDLFLERDAYSKFVQAVRTAEPLLLSGRQGSVFEAISKVRESIDLFREPGGSYSYSRELQNRIQAYHARTNGHFVAGIQTPYPTLNDTIIGLRPKNLATLAARPAVGKSFCVMLFALHAVAQGKRVLFISKEMSSEEVSERMDAIHFKLSYADLLRGRLSPVQLEKYKSGKLPDSLVISDAEDSGGIGGVRAEIIKYRPDFVIIDGAYLLAGFGKSDLVHSTTLLSRSMKRLAKSRNIPILQVVQMNRQAGPSGGGLETIGWSDAYAQDSDFVFEICGNTNEEKRTFKVHKARNGRTAQFDIRFQVHPEVDLSELRAPISRSLLTASNES